MAEKRKRVVLDSMKKLLNVRGNVKPNMSSSDDDDRIAIILVLSKP